MVKQVKKNKRRKRGRAPLFIMILILILAALLYFNFRGNNIKLSKDERVLIVGKQNLFAVYEDKLAIKIPFELNINNDETIQDLVDTKNYENVLEKINAIMPEKMERVTVIKEGNLQLEVENEKNIPETNVGDKRLILTSSVSTMFKDLYNEKNSVNELNENILVDVLNANGRGGYARKTGELIKNNLGMKYNAANYEAQQEESSIILNDISKEKATEIIEKLPEKYFKLKSKSTIPTLANVVVILGKEEKIDFKVEVHSMAEEYKNAIETLKKQGYKNLSNHRLAEDVEHSVIEYNKEDYFIAVKISKLLNIPDMIEMDSLKNKINVIVK